MKNLNKNVILVTIWNKIGLNWSTEIIKIKLKEKESYKQKYEQPNEIDKNT